MSTVEAILAGLCVFSWVGSLVISLWYRELSRKECRLRRDNDRIEELLDLAKEKNALLTKQLYESDKKAKLSGDVLAVLNDMKQGGAVFEVTRIDRNDIFFHNGSQYR